MGPEPKMGSPSTRYVTSLILNLAGPQPKLGSPSARHLYAIWCQLSPVISVVYSRVGPEPKRSSPSARQFASCFRAGDYQLYRMSSGQEGPDPNMGSPSARHLLRLLAAVIIGYFE